VPPTRYPLAINLKTAKATGIELPLNFVALADEDRIDARRFQGLMPVLLVTSEK